MLLSIFIGFTALALGILAFLVLSLIWIGFEKLIERIIDPVQSYSDFSAIELVGLVLVLSLLVLILLFVGLGILEVILL